MRSGRACSIASGGKIGIRLPGVNLPVLVRVPIDGVVEKIGADAAVVEQGISLTRGAIAHDLFPGAPELDQKLEQRALRLLHVRREPVVALCVVNSALLLAREHVRHRLGLPAWVSGMRDIHSEGAAVTRQFVDVDDLQAVRAHHGGDGAQGEVGEVLVVDRVVLEAVE